jgi:hypothetical protein
VQRQGRARSVLAAYIERHSTKRPQRTVPSRRLGKHADIPLGDLGFDFKKMEATSATINFSIEF